MIEINDVNAVKAKMEELKNDPSFVEKAAKLESMEDIAALIREKGINVTADQLKDGEKYQQENMNGELSEEQLEQASGGGLILSLVGAAYVVWCICGFFKGTKCRR